MKIIKFLLIFAIIILETTVFPVTVTGALIVALSIATTRDEPGLIFALGLLHDMFMGSIWGVTSIFFLGLYLLTKRYQKKLHSGSPIFQIILMMLASCAQSYLYYKRVEVLSILLAACVGMIFLHIVYSLDPHRGGGKYVT